MRKLLPIVLAAVLLPAAAAAQKVPPVKNAPVREAPAVITLDQARATALGAVYGGLMGGKLGAWGGGQGGGIRPADLKAAGALFNPTGGKNGIYIVGVTAPGASGHVRVLVDAKTGAVLGSRVGSWDWGNTPDWWVKGLNSPPPAKSN